MALSLAEMLKHASPAGLKEVQDHLSKTIGDWEPDGSLPVRGWVRKTLTGKVVAQVDLRVGGWNGNLKLETSRFVGWKMEVWSGSSGSTLEGLLVVDD